jgi:DNA polymerase III subunit chi
VTRIDFYRYADDKVRVACRLAAKVFAKPNKLVVYTPDVNTLAEFDRMLWSYQQTGFVPHCYAQSPLAPETPVVLCSSAETPPHTDVLLNLGDEWPPFFASFERVLEIVGTDEEDKARARLRWTFYKERGYELKVNDLEG